MGDTVTWLVTWLGTRLPGAGAKHSGAIRAALALPRGKAKPPGGPSAQVLPVPAFLQEKGLRGRDCVYLTTKGKCIAGKRLTCKNSLEMGFLARGQRLLGVMNINFQRT